MLIAQMVVRNEADRYLHTCLSSLSKFVDKIVITDDASEDDTIEICKQYTEYINPLSDSLFETNEGRLRQIAWDYLASIAKNGDWILAIDADEILWQTHSDLSSLLKDDYNILQLLFVNMWSPSKYRIDKTWQPDKVNKLFRFLDGGTIRQRNLACGSEPTYVEEWLQEPHNVNRNTGLVLQHLGYISDEDKRAKYDRYIKIDNGKYHNIFHLRSILTTPRLAPWSDIRTSPPQ